MALTLSKLLKNTENKYGLTLLAGKNGLENTVRWVHMVEDTEVPDFLHGDELVFTTGIANHQNDWLLYFVKSLKNHNASGVVINLGPYIQSIPPQVIVYCEQNDFPLFTIPWETRIIDISYKFCRLIISDEKQDQSLAEAFKNLILNPDEKEGYTSTLEKLGFVEASKYTVLLASFSEDEKDVTTKFLRDNGTKISKFLRCNSLAKAVFIWNKNLVLIYQNLTDTALDLLKENFENFCSSKINLSFGISSSEESYKKISDLYSQAKSALKMANVLKKSFVNYSEIGVYKILLNQKNQELINSYYMENLEKLIAYDKQHASDLFITLRSYCENSGSVSDMAEFFGVHRNTVNYKMKKIKEILGIDFSYKNIMDLMLSFAISDILN